MFLFIPGYFRPAGMHRGRIVVKDLFWRERTVVDCEAADLAAPTIALPRGITENQIAAQVLSGEWKSRIGLGEAAIQVDTGSLVDRR